MGIKKKKYPSNVQYSSGCVVWYTCNAGNTNRILQWQHILRKHNFFLPLLRLPLYSVTGTQKGVNPFLLFSTMIFSLKCRSFYFLFLEDECSEGVRHPPNDMTSLEENNYRRFAKRKYFEMPWKCVPWPKTLTALLSCQTGPGKSVFGDARQAGSSEMGSQIRD